MSKASTASGLVERDADLAAAVAVLERARAGRGSLVAVECDAGGGKTSLIDAVVAKARADGFQVLSAHGLQFESSLEFGTARRLFGQVPASVLAQAPAAASEVLQLTGDDQSGEDQYASCFGLFWICAELSEKRPVVLVVDDAQWSDDASIGFLRFVRERADDLALAIVVGTRPVAAVDTPLAHLVNDPRTALVRPNPLSPEGAAKLLRAQLPDLADDVLAAAHSATGGNPYFVGCILGELAANPGLEADDVARLVPDVVTRAMLSRVSALPGRALDVARAVAILGEDSEPRFVAGLVDVPAAEVLGTADVLHTAGILTDGRPLEFLHPIMRSAVLAGMSSGQVSLERRRAAAVLVDGDAPAIRAAVQLLEAEPLADPWVVDQLVRGAESLRGAGRHRIATTLLRRALAEPPKSDRRGLVLAALGTAERHTMEPEAIRHLGEALPLVPHGQGIAAKVVFELAAAYESRGQLPDAVRLLDKVRGVASAEPGRLDELETARVSAFAAGMRIVGLLPSLVEDVHAAETRMAELGRGRESRVIAGMLAAERCLRGTEPGQAAQVLEIARIAIGSGLIPEDLALPLTYGVLAAVVAAGEPRLAVEAVDVNAVARATGSPWAAAGVAVWTGYARLNTGELTDADADLTDAIEHLAAGSAPVGLAAAVAFQAEVDLERRGPAAARATLDAHRDAIGDLQVAQFAFYLRADATVALAEGDPLAAGIAARRLGDLVEAAAMSAPTMYPWRLQLAQAESALGRTVSAERLLAEHLELVRTFGEPAALADALVVAAAMAEEPPAAKVLLEEALASATENPLALARVLEAHGEHLVAAGEPDRARESFERALDIADRARAEWRRARIGKHLAALGVQVRRTPEVARDQLTPSELRTCRLAQDGLTNREIAQTLFVSTKTVETHLRAAFRKLGVASRQELAAALTDA